MGASKLRSWQWQGGAGHAARDVHTAELVSTKEQQLLPRGLRRGVGGVREEMAVGPGSRPRHSLAPLCPHGRSPYVGCSDPVWT